MPDLEKEDRNMPPPPTLQCPPPPLQPTGILGLGYVGLPLALTLSQAHLAVVGLDIDQAKINLLQAGESPLRHISAQALQLAQSAGWLRFTADPEQLNTCQQFILCVPTPLTPQQEPDISAICQAAQTIAPHLQPGALVILESTTYPGTTLDLLKPLLEQGSGLQAGHDFALAYSPEREDPGNPTYATKDIVKLVGGLTQDCTEKAQSLYQQAGIPVHPVSSPTVAEMAKLLENTFRSVNIALVNELKMLCHRMHIDIFEVIEAASSKPFGFMPFWPGPGTGGHCIPIDPLYLLWQARKFGFTPTLVATAAQINSHMPQYVCQRISLALNQQQRSISGSRVLLIGLAYKQGVEDVRCSPALTILQSLTQLGGNVTYHDPLVPWIEDPNQPGQRLYSQSLNEDLLEQQHVVVIVTKQTAIDYTWLKQHAPAIVDTRHTYSPHEAQILPA